MGATLKPRLGYRVPSLSSGMIDAIEFTIEFEGPRCKVGGVWYDWGYLLDLGVVIRRAPAKLYIARSSHAEILVTAEERNALVLAGAKHIRYRSWES